MASAFGMQTEIVYEGYMDFLTEFEYEQVINSAVTRANQTGLDVNTIMDSSFMLDDGIVGEKQYYNVMTKPVRDRNALVLLCLVRNVLDVE